MVKDIRHPEYSANYLAWDKYRATLIGGDYYINMYLQKFSARETTTDFETRKLISYCPAHAKSAILEIKDGIYQRMSDIVRKTNCESFNMAANGEGLGVDMSGNTMNNFLGNELLLDLLALGKVGVYVDRQPIPEGATLLDTKEAHPYIYMYPAEAILSWAYNDKNQLSTLLLEDNVRTINSDCGLTDGEATEYRLLTLADNGVTVRFFDNEGTEAADREVILNLSRIPFVVFELSDSLFTDIANYQIALLNLASSDMNYSVKSNFPFYTEQYSPIADVAAKQVDGESARPAAELRVGVTQGKRYPKGLERPGYINPSAEPLRASMEKQDQLKHEIRTLIHLAVTNITSKQASAESKAADQKGLEAGLAAIGLELEYGERQIAEIYCEYLGIRKPEIVVSYPRQYSLKTDEDYDAEAKRLLDLIPKIPSLTYRKILAKKVARLTAGREVSLEQMEEIEKEIDNAANVVTTPSDLLKDFEAGLVSEKTASELRGYPEKEVEQARKDKIERTAAIIAAQVPNKNELKNPAARGASDLSADPKEEAKEEKKEAFEEKD